MEYFDPSLPVIEFDEPIDAPGTPFHGCTGFIQTYDWLPYGYWRVITLLRDYYNLEVVNIWQGYKSNRRPGYQELYQLVDCDTKEVIVPLTCMRTMQQFLAHQGFAQYSPKVKRHDGCERFLALLEHLREEV